jgi:adenylyltransferase/sulfurtransferase
MAETVFSADEWLRYTRHIQLANFGITGQKKLKQSHLVIIGAGGLGCPAALYLAAAGVGKITLVDGDQVDITNLQRQVGFDMTMLGQNKAEALKTRLCQLNPDIELVAKTDDLSLDNAQSIIQSADLVLDCTDNFATRYLINDVCYQLSKPWIMASIGEFYGQSSLFVPSHSINSDNISGACFRCLFPQQPDNIKDCNSAGVLGVLPGMLAMYQTAEAIKFLVGLETPLQGNLLIIDAITMTQNKFKLQKNSDCHLCSQSKEKIDLSLFSEDYQRTCDSDKTEPMNITPKEFERYQHNQNLAASGVVLLDVRTSAEREGYHIGGLHIPLDQLEQRLAELKPDKHYLVYCQSGVRGLKASKLLSQKGFSRVNNLQGGLLAWLKRSS